jgi:hypothetical protein
MFSMQISDHPMTHQIKTIDGFTLNHVHPNMSLIRKRWLGMNVRNS